MIVPWRLGAAITVCASLAGCAIPIVGPALNRATRITTIAAHSATDAITVGKSTKADVLAALGRTSAIHFDSGYEIWVYKYEGKDDYSPSVEELIDHAVSGNGTLGKTEFVVLFAPSGVVTKTRVRPAPTLPGKVAGG
jgi:hypothetical protein